MGLPYWFDVFLMCASSIYGWLSHCAAGAGLLTGITCSGLLTGLTCSVTAGSAAGGHMFLLCWAVPRRTGAWKTFIVSLVVAGRATSCRLKFATRYPARFGNSSCILASDCCAWSGNIKVVPPNESILNCETSITFGD